MPSPPVPSPSGRGPSAPSALSAAEQRFDVIRRTVGMALGPLALAIVWVLPFPELSEAAHRTAAITALVVVWWVTEAIPIPVTAIVGTALASVLGVTTAAQAFAPFASPTIFLFIGSFIIARGVETHGLDRRIATSLLTHPAVGSHLGRIRIAVCGLTLVLSAWMSNAATTAMMLPLVLGIASAHLGAGARKTGPATTGLLLVTASSATLGGMMTPVGTPPNIITIGFLEQAADIRINFFDWMLLAVPIAGTMFLVLFLVARWRFPIESLGRDTGAAETASALDEPGTPWTPGQRNCAIAFLVAVTLWVGPGALALVAPDSPLVQLLRERLNEGAVAVVAATLLFLLPVDWKRRQFTLDWRQAAGIDWGTILLFGGGLALGQLMFQTGLAEHVGRSLVDLSGVESLWGVTVVAVAISIAMTELTSNTAATNMLIPVVISIAQATGISPVVPALGAGLAASLAFMLPISTPPNAIVYGSGLIPIRAMMGFGVIMNIVGYVIILVGLRVLAPLLGYV